MPPVIIVRLMPMAMMPYSGNWRIMESKSASVANWPGPQDRHQREDEQQHDEQTHEVLVAAAAGLAGAGASVAVVFMAPPAGRRRARSRRRFEPIWRAVTPVPMMMTAPVKTRLQ